MLMIFMYIFVWTIWCKGQHFQMAPVEGLHRLQLQEHTKGWCNPNDVECEADYHPIADLPYCARYTGQAPAKVVRPCEYYDARELPIQLAEGILIPTYMEYYKQLRTCEPAAMKCRRKWTFVDAEGAPQAGHGGAEAVTNAFVADAGDFTLLIDHSFR